MKQTASQNPVLVEIDGHSLTLAQIVRVARQGAKVQIAETALQNMRTSRDTVERILQREAPVYGINTGFGSLSSVRISNEQTGLLQKNLILSHAVGCGQPLPTEVVRAMLLLRANALCQGYSGIRPVVVETLISMLNRGVHPVVPSKGSLGASGDLAPLSHMAMVMLGHGEAEVQGQILPGAEAMEKAGLPLVSLQAKEGLALINGTQLMGGLGALALQDALDLCKLADISAAMTLEALQGQLDAFDERVHAVRPHQGQKLVANNIRALCADSGNLAACKGQRVQDAYSLRCVPQVHGAVRGAVKHVEEVLGTEFNAVTDNPLIFSDDETVISGGNFHGEPLALALDYLGIAVAELANISERRLERLVNPQLSGGLPPFLARDAGVNSGMMIVQYTAASLVSENKVLAHPASVDSIPSSANQEDHVSMGATAARKLRQIVENTQSVLSLELMASAQALDLRGCEPSPVIRAVLDRIRKKVPALQEDRELRFDVNAMHDLVRSGELTQLVMNHRPAFQ
ncbi:MAG: histidine ammonia-lyase [Clostridiales bacterium]|nr:histidine ammonia-lyase [Clostridiales bacterium]